MEDTVTIQFCPTEWRYYSDNLRVHTQVCIVAGCAVYAQLLAVVRACKKQDFTGFSDVHLIVYPALLMRNNIRSVTHHVTSAATSTDISSACVAVQGGNLLIPIHAYPMMNQTSFPRRISFGKCGIGESTTRRVNLTCNVPIDFEYEITVIKPNAAFAVQPAQGIVPANGVMQIKITFSPSRLVTELMEIEVHRSHCLTNLCHQLRHCTCTPSLHPPPHRQVCQQGWNCVTDQHGSLYASLQIEADDSQCHDCQVQSVVLLYELLLLK